MWEKETRLVTGVRGLKGQIRYAKWAALSTANRWQRPDQMQNFRSKGKLNAAASKSSANALQDKCLWSGWGSKNKRISTWLIQSETVSGNALNWSSLRLLWQSSRRWLHKIVGQEELHRESVTWAARKQCQVYFLICLARWKREAIVFWLYFLSSTARLLRLFKSNREHIRSRIANGGYTRQLATAADSRSVI